VAGYPKHWVDTAVPYHQLKKCVKRVQQELRDLGLDKDTMRQLMEAQTTSDCGECIASARYRLDCKSRTLFFFLLISQGTNYQVASASDVLRPRLTVSVHVVDGVAVDASLSPASRAFLQKLASSRTATVDGDEPNPPSPMTSNTGGENHPVSE
jgi:hypothetical protein